jgi:putative phage-type endonuclease
MIKITYGAQGTPEWEAARTGHITSTRLATIMQSKSSLGYKAMVDRLACEIWTGLYDESDATSTRSKAMARGTSMEAEALEQFMLETGIICESVAFVSETEQTWPIGTSPDGLTEAGEPVEIKCPLRHTHFGALVSQEIPEKHKLQCQHHLQVTGADRGHYYSYHPDFAVDEQVHIIYEPDLELLSTVYDRLDDFYSEVKAKIESLRGRK